ncbi:MAG: carboxypeptidase regulatory-like domain-containing protein [Candidatus Acidiferrales bacterium]
MGVVGLILRQTQVSENFVVMGGIGNMSKRFGIKYVLLFSAVAILITLLSGGRLWAQAQTATLSGTATDPSGAAVAGAKITVTNTGTNVPHATTTNAQGFYSVPDLTVGTYSVTASQSGFQTVVKTGVTLTVGSTVVANVSLPVGQVSQTVSVEANAAQVQTETSSVSNLVSPAQVANLPLNGRNIEQLLTLTPGVVAMAPTLNFVTGRMYGMQNNYSISGGRPTGQMFLLDGTDIRDFWEHGIGSGYAGTELGISSISQFQVITSNGNAQYAGNGIISEVSKSGTNDFHGGVYEYFRNNALDAMDISDKVAGLTSPVPFRQNQFGADIGGPIKKNKLFFFANFEGLRNNQATAISGVGVPEPYVMAGMAPCYDIFGNPSNTSPAAGDTCPGEPAGSQLLGGNTPVVVGGANDPIYPVAGANTQAQEIASIYTLCKGCRPFAESTTFGPPTNPNSIVEPIGTDYGGYSYVATAPALVNHENYVLGRIDYNIGPSDSLFGRYVLDHANVLNGTQDLYEIFPETDYTRNHYFTLAENHIISSTMVNVLRFGFVRTFEGMSTPLGLSPAEISAASTYSSANGGPAFSTDPLDFIRSSYATTYGEPGRPDGTVAVSGSGVLGPDQNRPNIYDNKFSGGDDLSWTHGNHTLKIGGVVTRVQVNVDQESYAAGEEYIAYLSPVFSANTLTPYIQGSPFIAFAAPPNYANDTRYFREIDMAPYFQDDWKVTSNLTLNLGIRYDYATNPVGWSGGNQPLTAITGAQLPPTGPLTTTPACAASDFGTGAAPLVLDAADCIQQFYTPVKHAFASNPNSHNWEPRFGFAYSPFKNNKTAIRGGFGVFSDPTAARIYESSFTASSPAGYDEVFYPGFPDVFSTTAPKPLGAAPGTCIGDVNNPFRALNPCPEAEPYAAVIYQDNWGSPYTLQYNFDVQQQLTPGTVLTVSYVGNVARHLWNQRDINPPECYTDPSNLSSALTSQACTALPQVPKSYPTASNATYTVNTNLNTATSQTDPNQCVESSANGYSAPQPTCYGSGVRFPYQVNIIGGEEQLSRINPAFDYFVMEAPTAASSYNSLQVGLNHQFSRSLSAQVNYTYSHCIDDGSFATSLEEFSQLQLDGYNQANDYENCNFDIRHNLNINGIYALPFKGNRLVSGWQFATIINVHDGLPINITNGESLDPANLGSQYASRPNYSFAPGCSPNHIVDKAVPGKQYYTQWYDPSCYEPQAPGFLGNVRRNSVPGPGTFDMDFSVIKNTKITEKLNMQFRCEAFNVLNHFNLGAPGGGVNLAGAGAGQSDFSNGTPRQIQFALKLDF